MQSFTLQSKKTFVYSCAITINFGLNRYYLNDLMIKTFRFPEILHLGKRASVSKLPLYNILVV